MGALDISLTSQFVGDPSQRGGFLVLAGLLGGFLFIRTSARLIRANVSWWPGNVQTGGGLHIHHLVWGICTIMLAGLLEFALQPDPPWRDWARRRYGRGSSKSKEAGRRDVRLLKMQNRLLNLLAGTPSSEPLDVKRP